MLSPKLKSDVRKLWNYFLSGGIANQLTAIEQITYLVFLKRLEDLDDERARKSREANRPHQSIFTVPDAGIETPGDEASRPTITSGKEFLVYRLPKQTGEPSSRQEIRRLKRIDPNTFRWSHIKQLPGEERLNHLRGPVFDWLKGLEGYADRVKGFEGNAERMRDAVFVIPSASLLHDAIEIIDGLFAPSRDQATLGDIYECLLSEIAEAGKSGQFRTPRHIIRAMCDLVDPQPGERIVDPACGTAGFLVNAYQHILKCHTSADTLEFEADGSPANLDGDLLTPAERDDLRRNYFYGFDFDRTVARLGWMNMVLHGLEDPQVNFEDSLGSRFNKRLLGGEAGYFDVVLANFPSAGNIDRSNMGESLRSLDTDKTDLLFVELTLQLLRKGGRAAVIVPESMLSGSTRAHREIRRKLVKENQLKAVVSLPDDVFQPYAKTKAAMLIFARGGETDEVWFYDVTADGLSSNAARTEQYEQNDLWDMTLKYRLRNAASFARPAPAFVDGDTWRKLEALEPAARSRHYAKPMIAIEKREDTAAKADSDTMGEPEMMDVPLFKGIELNLLGEEEEAKDWSVSQEDVIEKDYKLSAGSYKPIEFVPEEHEPPAQIIRELQAMEQKVQEGLSRLLAMVEGEQ